MITIESLKSFRRDLMKPKHILADRFIGDIGIIEIIISSNGRITVKGLDKNGDRIGPFFSSNPEEAFAKYKEYCSGVK